MWRPLTILHPGVLFFVDQVFTPFLNQFINGEISVNGFPGLSATRVSLSRSGCSCSVSPGSCPSLSSGVGRHSCCSPPFHVQNWNLCSTSSLSSSSLWTWSKGLVVHERSSPISGFKEAGTKFICPYKIEKVVKTPAAKLQLPASLRVHPTFHIPLIKQVSSSHLCPPPPPHLIDGVHGPWNSGCSSSGLRGPIPCRLGGMWSGGTVLDFP